MPHLGVHMQGCATASAQAAFCSTDVLQHPELFRVGRERHIANDECLMLHSTVVALLARGVARRVAGDFVSVVAAGRGGDTRSLWHFVLQAGFDCNL
jgi:hypothetical protein